MKPALIARTLRQMPDDRLAVVQPADFQRWPTPADSIAPGATIRELIRHERERRAA